MSDPETAAHGEASDVEGGEDEQSSKKRMTKSEWKRKREKITKTEAKKRFHLTEDDLNKLPSETILINHWASSYAVLYKLEDLKRIAAEKREKKRKLNQQRRIAKELKKQQEKIEQEEIKQAKKQSLIELEGRIVRLLNLISERVLNIQPGELLNVRKRFE